MIEDLLSEASARGWYLYSLRDRADGHRNPWEATLRHPSCLASYGQGATAELALSAALDGIERAQPHELPKVGIADVPDQAVLAKILRKLPVICDRRI
jgi:hypothetical protein